MKILVTGTHFTPAVALIRELKKNYQADVVYVGRKTTLERDETPSVESQVLPKLGVKFISLTAGRLQRRFSIYTFFSLLKIPLGFLQAPLIILREKPKIVLSFGGYVVVPMVIWAWLFSIPIIIHEQGLYFGLANKLSSPFASKIAISFPQSAPASSKIVLTGNPSLKPAHPRGVYESRWQILITGGSQGAHVINMAVEHCLDKLTRLTKVIHQTGDSKFKDFERLKQRQNENYRVEKFIDSGWEDLLSESDLVVTRAGINTLSELAYLKKPTLVIPIAGHLEQNVNATFFKKMGLAKILPQPKLSGQSLLKNIKNMLNNLDQLKHKAKGARRFIIPDGAKRLALETALLNN